uniref:Uncharacterized protein n=1 Tax=Anguilla anguilla TaxID=7936 RepID=A0A0E9UA93_ANGAN
MQDYVVTWLTDGQQSHTQLFSDWPQPSLLNERPVMHPSLQ